MDIRATPDSLAKTFAELRASGPIIRSILIQDRYAVGQRFCCDGFQAVQLAASNEIAFYDQEGTLLATTSFGETKKNIAA